MLQLLFDLEYLNILYQLIGLCRRGVLVEGGWTNGQGSSHGVVQFYFLTIHLAIFELRRLENETSSSIIYILTRGDSRRRTAFVKKARTKSKLNSGNSSYSFVLKIFAVLVPYLGA
jgi:hypothetical protein